MADSGGKGFEEKSLEEIGAGFDKMVERELNPEIRKALKAYADAIMAVERCYYRGSAKKVYLRVPDDLKNAQHAAFEVYQATKARVAKENAPITPIDEHHRELVAQRADELQKLRAAEEYLAWAKNETVKQAVDNFFDYADRTVKKQHGFEASALKIQFYPNLKVTDETLKGDFETIFSALENNDPEPDGLLQLLHSNVLELFSQEGIQRAQRAVDDARGMLALYNKELKAFETPTQTANSTPSK